MDGYCKYHKKTYTGSNCFWCQRARAICKSKIAHRTWFEAELWADEYNESHDYVKPQCKYKCRWCSYWHTTTTKRKGKAMRKKMHKWMIRKRLDAAN